MLKHLLSGWLLVLGLCRLGAADKTTTINASSNWGTWEGWGTSLAWWAAAFGNRDDLADIFFSLKSTRLGGQTLPGLGFNIARYNAGACSKVPIGGESMAISPKMIPSRMVDGFWVNWNNSDPKSSSWNWNVDANQRSMLLKARDRGANIFELFSNSPMWWMCKNHNPAGADDGSQDNLQSWNYQQFSAYLATIAKHARDEWNLAFQSVEPFNEPMAGWWNARTGTQEGCHFDSKTQATIITQLRKELDSRGLGGTGIAASDENSYDQAIATWKALGREGVAGQVSRINVHGYQYGGGQRDVLAAAAQAAGKPLWNSEYGKADYRGAELVSNLLLDLRWLHPTAWVYWQVLDGGGWGLVEADNDARTVAAASQAYFALAQFARHVRPGMRLLDAGADYAAAAYDPRARKLVVVAVNWGDPQYLAFDLSRFRSAGADNAPVPRWATQLGSGEQYGSHPDDTRIQGKKFWSYFQKEMVQTFEISNVDL